LRAEPARRGTSGYSDEEEKIVEPAVRAAGRRLPLTGRCRRIRVHSATSQTYGRYVVMYHDQVDPVQDAGFDKESTSRRPSDHPHVRDHGTRRIAWEGKASRTVSFRPFYGGEDGGNDKKRTDNSTLNVQVTDWR